MSGKYRLTMFHPLAGKMDLPSALITSSSFDRCPACGSERILVTRLRVAFSCGMTQLVSDEGQFAISAGCPYAMAAIYEMGMKRVERDKTPDTLMTFQAVSFAANEKVRWKSQSAGRETWKKGIVVAVVPPHARPEAYIPDGLRKNSSNGYGRSRTHTTYLIKVRGKGNMVYWPRVHLLDRI